jgi:hypothetical protein
MHTYYILASFDVKAPTAPAALYITLQCNYSTITVYILYIYMCGYICI